MTDKCNHVCVCYICQHINRVQEKEKTNTHRQTWTSKSAMELASDREEGAQTNLKEVPQVHEVAGEHELLRLRDEAVGHEAEVLH